MRKTILLMIGVPLLNVAAQKRMPPPVIEGPSYSKGITKEQMWRAEKLQKELEKLVAAKYKGEVKSEIRQGPYETLLVRAWFPGAYPGTGVVSAFVDKTAVTYGIHGERDFADFVRAQGWLKREPEVEDFMKLLDFAQFEAVVMNMDHLEKARLSFRGEDLVLHFIRGFMPNGAYPTEVIVGKKGGVKVEQKTERKR